MYKRWINKQVSSWFGIPNQNFLKSFYQNTHSLRTKLRILNCNISTFSCIFIVLTETWLHSNIHDSELGFTIILVTNYNIYRCGRSILSSSCPFGGGVLIGIREDIPSYLIPYPSLNIEQVFVKFSIGSNHFVLGGIYFPPNSSLHLCKLYTDLVDSIINEHKNCTYLLFGD